MNSNNSNANASIFSALLVIASSPIVEVDRCKLCGLLPDFCPCDRHNLFEVTLTPACPDCGNTALHMGRCLACESDDPGYFITNRS